MSYLFWRLRKLVSAGKVLIRDGNTFRGILPEDVATSTSVDPETDGDLDLGSDSSHRWRTLRLATSLILSASGTLVVGANTLVGAVANKLNATHLALAGQTIGDLLYADSTTTFARRAAVGVGQVLKSAGVGTAPAWGAIGGSTASTAAAALAVFAAPAAAGVNVHAAISSDNAAPVTTGLTNPAIPRTLQVVFTALWDGGDVTIIGTDQFDAAVTETILNIPGSTAEGVKVFKTVTSISNSLTGAGGGLTATVQTGEKLGLSALPSGPGSIATCDGVIDEADLNTTYGSVDFATAPNGSRAYVVTYASTHTHSGTGLT
jgi:hypothetical protein